MCIFIIISPVSLNSNCDLSQLSVSYIIQIAITFERKHVINIPTQIYPHSSSTLGILEFLVTSIQLAAHKQNDYSNPWLDLLTARVNNSLL